MKFIQLIFAGLLVSLVTINESSAQGGLISGPTEVRVGSTQTYTCPSCYLSTEEFGGASYWAATNGTVTSNIYNSSTVTVLWSGTPGSGAVIWRNSALVFKQRSVTVGDVPSAPPTPNFVYECTQGRLLFSGTPPSGVTWYWQSSSTGESVANSSSEWVVSAGNYFLRAKNNFGWSSAATIHYPGSDPVIPLNPIVTNNARCEAGAITLQSNSNSDRWYLSASGGSAVHAGSSYSPTISSSQIYYVEAVTTFNCISTTRSLVTATIDPATNGGSLNSGVNVFGSASGSLTLSGSIGAVQKWQFKVGEGMWTDLTNTSNTYNYSQVTSTTSFQAVVKSGICPAVNSSVASIIINPLPVITASSNKIIMGEPVTLDAGAGYSSYTWKDASQNTVETQRYFVTRLPNTYQVTVSKAGVSGAGTSLGFSVVSQLDGININYIVSNKLQRAVKAKDSIDLLKVADLSQSIQYFDGLGRSIQSVITQGATNKQDVVQPVAYDAYGRKAVDYLPYISTERNGAFKGDGINKQHSFYSNTTDQVQDDLFPYSITSFEASPLNRVSKQGAPGEIWQPDPLAAENLSDRTIKKSYEVNTAAENILLFTYNKLNGIIENQTTYYQANTLKVLRTWDEMNHEVIEFIDMEGRTICKRVQSGGTSSSPQFASTYYLYDDLSNLVVVIPPEGVEKLKTLLNLN